MDSLSQLLFGTATWFTLPALVGTGGFLVRLLFAWIAGDDSHDEGASGDPAAGGEGVAIHSDIAAATISVQGLLTFLMGFGWGGLASYRAAELSVGWSALVGALCGLVLLAITALLLRAMRQLQSTGNISLDQLAGLEGEAYTIIPALGKGQGQIRAVVGERQRFVYAVAEGEEIPARTRVKVVRVNGDNSVTVVRL